MSHRNSSRRRWKNTAGTAVAIALMAGWGGSVQAQTVATYPGSSCQAAGTVQDLTYASGGPQISNRQSTTSSANCPIVRRNGFGGWLAIGVVVRDRHSTQDISCTVFADDLTGVAGGGWQETQTSVGEGDQALSFGPPGVAVPNFGPYSIVCTLPPIEEANQPSWIASYLVVEP